MRASVRRALVVLSALLALPPAAEARTPVTPAGWAVRPAGARVAVSAGAAGFQGPIGSALSPGGTKLLTVSSGVSRINSTDLFSLSTLRRLSSVRYDGRRGLGEAVFYGVTFSLDGRRAWASGGGQNVVHAYTLAGRRLVETAQIPAPWFPAGLAYGRTPRGDRLYVANNLDGPAAAGANPPGRRVTVIDPLSNTVTGQIDLGFAAQPLGVAFERRGRKAYVTHWMGRSVSVINTTVEAVRARITLSPATDPLKADHPSAVTANPRRDEVYTANSNSDTVSVIDTRRDRLAATIDVSLVPGALKGALPNGLAASPDGRTLYVTLGGENAVAVVDLDRRRTRGFIPTSWYPTDVKVRPSGGRIVVTAANAALPRPDRCQGPAAIEDCTNGDLAYQSTLPSASTKGSVAVVEVPRTRRGLRRMTARVLRNNRVHARRAPKPAWLGAIRHVIYVIKENRTYDQVLGDLGKGDGDPSLTLFKDDSAPNHRELARRFVLFDNFFADAEVSADGHSWVAASGVTDYAAKTWPMTYSPAPRRTHRARDFEEVPAAASYLTLPLAFDATVFRPPAALTGGFLWDNAYFNGVSYRSYGEWTNIPGDCHGDGNFSRTTHLDDTRFGDHVDDRFPGFNLDCSDHAVRQPEWEREFRYYESLHRADPKVDPLPQLQLVRLPNDHTYGTRPGKASPLAYMADNDLALGRLVETVSRSAFWPSTVILVTEDDAQNGPDHVDAHRTLAYVISPYTQTGKVDSTHYDTAAMNATLEDLLGLDPMTITDQRATRMWKAFARRPDYTPYTALEPKVVPFGRRGAERNLDSAPLAGRARAWDFSIEDATPEIALNEAIWKSVKGRGSTMPEPRHDFIIGQRPVEPGG